MSNIRAWAVVFLAATATACKIDPLPPRIGHDGAAAEGKDTGATSDASLTGADASAVTGTDGSVVAGTGGTSSTDGSVGAGGVTGKGGSGSTSTSGTNGLGGAIGTGGILGTGGVGTGGAAPTGGTTSATGGTVSSGGTRGAGGIVGSGGAAQDAGVDVPVVPSGTVSTLAGTPGQTGSADGTGAAARFNAPEGVAVDGSGIVYVADYRNHIIRKVAPLGEVSTLAGSPGQAGSSDGTGAAARFNFPGGVAVDESGNIYVADTKNHTIRKIAPAGVVSTLAGTPGLTGSADGTGAAARFSSPAGVAVDGAGNVYVADWSNDTIRMITPAGMVSTLAGTPGLGGSADGTGAAARFSSPASVAVDGTGNVYVADYGDDTIRKITPAGVSTTLAGSPGQYGSTDGTGAAALFSMPTSVAVDGAGNVYVADFGNHTIRKITPSGVVSTLAGTPGLTGSSDGTSTAALFYHPDGVAVDRAGNVYVADFSNNTIRKIAP